VWAHKSVGGNGFPSVLMRFFVASVVASAFERRCYACVRIRCLTVYAVLENEGVDIG
jgi:Na+(H+)/acetate symporter ActP